LSYFIYFIRKILSPVELNYTVTEKEFLVVVYAINKFKHCLTGCEVFVHTYHFSIKLLMNKMITNGRITRCLLLLREFNIIIIDSLGKENLIEYFLSRIQNGHKSDPVDDSFPNKHLFVISTNSSWFTNTKSYLATGKFPQHLYSRENKKIIKLNANYSWIRGDILFTRSLFHTRKDLIIRRCVLEDMMFDILRAFHDGPCGGHFFYKRTTCKALHQRYY
jgi:hypothetical protein